MQSKQGTHWLSAVACASVPMPAGCSQGEGCSMHVEKRMRNGCTPAPHSYKYGGGGFAYNVLSFERPTRKMFGRLPRPSSSSCPLVFGTQKRGGLLLRRDQQRWGFGLLGTASEAVDVGTTCTSAHAYSALLSGARAIITFRCLRTPSKSQDYAKYPDTPRFTCFGHVCPSQWKLRCCAISLPNSLTSATSHRTYHGSIPTQSSPRLLSRSQRKTPKNMASFQTPGSAFSVRWCRSERKSTPLPSGEW